LVKVMIASVWSNSSVSGRDMGLAPSEKIRLVNEASQSTEASHSAF
jgi:hypothetical protein